MSKKKDPPLAMAVRIPIYFILYFMTDMVEKQVKSKDKGSKGARRQKSYAFILYPESAVENWKETLEMTHVPILVSPLHDKDVNPDGAPKKEHYHVLVMFQTLKSLEQFKELRDLVGGVGNETVQSIRGYARYLIHRDNPEKAAYDAKDVIAMNGADYDALTHLPSDDEAVIRDMMQYCITNKIYSFAKFANLCSKHYPEWFTSLTHRTTYFMQSFIKSLQWTEENDSLDDLNKEKKLMYLVDPETGEQKEIYM